VPRNKSYDIDEVLEKAMHAFWKNGYEATSVRLLEQEMGINQFSIYSSFHDKRNLFIESLKKYRLHVMSKVFNKLLNEDAGIKDIEQFLINFSEKIKEGRSLDGCLVVNTAAEIGIKDELIFNEVNGYFIFVRGMFKDILLRSRERGEISTNTNVEKCSSYLLGIMQGLSIASKVMPPKQVNDFITIAIISIKRF
jgi:TetR/AcrR family transcriptional regulator, transcriptional repressor for nem operon